MYYFLTEKFEKIQDESLLDNLQSIFNRLLNCEKIYTFKPKYLQTLFDNKNLKNKSNKKTLLEFKLILLLYFSKKDQITTCPDPSMFFFTYKNFSNRKNETFYLKEVLSVFLNWSVNSDFIEKVEENLITELINIFHTHPYNDILHLIVYKVL